MSKRERDVFFLQFSWLVPKGLGAGLFEYIEANGLSGRWMPDRRKMRHQYLGETASAPIVVTADLRIDDYGIPSALLDAGIHPRPAVEQYLWEGTTLDCSLDQSVDFYTPTPELLGSARWRGHRAEWEIGGKVIARAIEVPDSENGQEMLLAESEWVRTRLRELDSDLVIGTLSERHALPTDDDDYRRMAFSDLWYAALVISASGDRAVGPFVTVRRKLDDDGEAAAQTAERVSDEPFDPDSI